MLKCFIWKSFDFDRSNSIDIRSLTSIKSYTTKKSHPTASSSTTSQSDKSDLIYFDRHCQRDYSSRRNSIEKEICHFLGAQLCLDCIQVQTHSNSSLKT